MSMQTFACENSLHMSNCTYMILPKAERQSEATISTTRVCVKGHFKAAITVFPSATFFLFFEAVERSCESNSDTTLYADKARHFAKTTNSGSVYTPNNQRVNLIQSLF